MAPTILVVGATGNTGRGVVEALPQLIQDNPALRNHRILALTRSASSDSAKQIAQLPGVEIAEQNWVEITAEWLQKHEVVRAFIASHNEPKHFAEEGQFHIEALRAGVKYVVRISTTAANVTPSFYAYYPRSHWAIETMLEQPDFEALHWTSLQPNIFTTMVMSPAAEFIKKFRETGQQDTLRLIFDENVGSAPIEPTEIGVFAAHLLTEQDTTKHNKAKYTLNGPEDISGSQIVAMVEKYIGEKVKDVNFKDVTFIDQWADSQTKESKNIIRSIKAAPQTAWDGKVTASTTSKEVLDISPPKRTPAQVLKTLLGQ